MSDHEAAKKFVQSFVRLIETNEMDAEFADDIFCDINVPEWRFQLQGKDKVHEWLSGEQPEGCVVVAWDAEETASGLLVEVEQHMGEELSRNMHRLEVRDGKIARWTMYCTGVWSKETQERQREQAPMISA